MPQFNHDSLVQLLSENVVELMFVHRRDGTPRRMLCTNSKQLLNSIAGKTALHFKPPKGVGLPYSPKAKNLAVTWDIMWQDFRQIPLESVHVVTAIPLKSEEDVDNFWEYFQLKLRDMSAAEKLQFMSK